MSLHTSMPCFTSITPINCHPRSSSTNQKLHHVIIYQSHATSSGMVSSLPFLIGLLSLVTFGWVADAMRPRLGTTAVRKILFGAAALLESILFYLIVHIRHTWQILVLMCAILFIMNIGISQVKFPSPLLTQIITISFFQ